MDTQNKSNAIGKYDVAAYIWPAYTGDEPRSKMFWPEGFGEWQSVKNAVKKFPEHNWPRKPLWGYTNEADPYVMEMQINAATDHGVNVFIYDWYWYDQRPFLENCLNDGFLKAKNNDKMKFYLMWANHDVNYTWDIRLSHIQDNVVWKGSVDRAEFEKIGKRLIEKYFTHPQYYKIDNKPVFMIYDTQNLINGLGGAESAKSAFDWLQNEAVKAGLDGIHFQMTVWGDINYNLSGVDSGASVSSKELVHLLGYESMSHYQYVHFTNIQRNYEEVLPDVLKEWDKYHNEYDAPYYPHVSIGWDNNPRFRIFKPQILKNNTPENFEKALLAAKKYVDLYCKTKLITINSWNEWTESSYLLPDDLYGYGYLEAIKRVFLSSI